MAVIRPGLVRLSRLSEVEENFLKVKEEVEKLSKDQKIDLIQNLVSELSKEEQKKVISLLEEQIPTEEQEAQNNYSKLQYLKKRIGDYQKLNSEEQKNSSSKLKGKGARLIREKQEEFLLEIRRELQKLEGLPMMKSCGNDFVWLSQEERTKEVEKVLSKLELYFAVSFEGKEDVGQEEFQKIILEKTSEEKACIKSCNSKFGLYESATEQMENLFLQCCLERDGNFTQSSQKNSDKTKVKDM